MSVLRVVLLTSLMQLGRGGAGCNEEDDSSASFLTTLEITRTVEGFQFSANAAGGNDAASTIDSLEVTLKLNDAHASADIIVSNPTVHDDGKMIFTTWTSLFPKDGSPLALHNFSVLAVLQEVNGKSHGPEALICHCEGVCESRTLYQSTIVCAGNTTNVTKATVSTENKTNDPAAEQVVQSVELHHLEKHELHRNFLRVGDTCKSSSVSASVEPRASNSSECPPGTSCVEDPGTSSLRGKVIYVCKRLFEHQPAKAKPVHGNDENSAFWAHTMFEVVIIACLVVLIATYCLCLRQRFRGGYAGFDARCDNNDSSSVGMQTIVGKTTDQKIAMPSSAASTIMNAALRARRGSPMGRANEPDTYDSDSDSDADGSLCCCHAFL